MPRSFAGLRMRRVFLIHGQLVADLSGVDQLAARSDVDQRAHPAAAGRVDPQPVVLIGNVRAGQRFPALGCIAGLEPVGLPAQRRHVAGQPADRPSAVFDVHGQRGAAGVDHAHCRADRLVEAGSHQIGAFVRQRIPHHHRPSTALDSSFKALSRAARPSSHASRQPVSRSRYT